MMDERELLVLGLLMVQSQHGYQINDFIEKNMGRVSDMKKATAYSLLKRLDKAGYVDVTIEQEGNRPPRQVYTITPQGEVYFLDLLRKSLGQMENLTPQGDISIMFMDHLPVEEVTARLQERHAKVVEYIDMLKSVPPHAQGAGIDISIQHRIALLECDEHWLSNTIEGLKNGTIQF
ncbi:PadR family transcriptional regulator [Paenibacillus sp. 1001270B_150601_E10]|uniref:PadR family transcriptional regulator n=1 Tax=Paenibacillus sp. 1001270B_150601_E10 TaxID=2787079 RepID=UPI001E41ACCE|nr:PadR family transcriptional regulator [Paenibacillus sp. 1001270B_150601_E10]